MSAGIDEEGRGRPVCKLERREPGGKRTQTEPSVHSEPMRAQPPSGASPRAVSIIQAGLMLNVSRSTIYRLIGAKRLRAIKVGARTVIPIASLDAILEGDQL
jgi:excisionase family DNA binding protein